MSFPKHLICLRGNKTKQNGKQYAYVRLYINRKTRFYIIPVVEFYPKDWDNNKRKLKAGAPHYAEFNKLINEFDNRAITILANCIKENKPVTFDLFGRELYNKGYETDFFEYAIDFINNKYSNNAGTKKGMKNSMSKFKTFIKGNISFGEIDKLLLEKYRQYCITVLKNKESTVNKSLKNIGTIINAAIEEEKIKNNPVNTLKFKTSEGKKETISLEAFQLLDVYFHNTEMSIAEKNSLGAYLFACTCGLRHSDIIGAVLKRAASFFLSRVTDFSFFQLDKFLLQPIFIFQYEDENHNNSFFGIVLSFFLRIFLIIPHFSYVEGNSEDTKIHFNHF